MAKKIDVDKQKLIKKVEDLDALLKKLGALTTLEKLIIEMKRPGWTTPAEFIFVGGMVDGINAMANQITAMQNVLLKGGRVVGK